MVRSIRVENGKNKRPDAEPGLFQNFWMGGDQGKELFIKLNVSPILGPISRTTVITTMATNERMIAYSTSP